MLYRKRKKLVGILAVFGEGLGGNKEHECVLLMREVDSGFDEDDSRRQLYSSLSLYPIGSLARLLPLIKYL